MPRAVLFDFNGVLVDDEPIHLRLLLRVLGEETVELDPDWAAAAFLGVDDRTCLRIAFEQSGRELPPERLSRLVARKATYYQQEIRDLGIPLAPGIRPVVEGLRAGGLRLGVVSGALRHEVEPALEQAGIRAAIEVLVTAEDVDRSKPEPDGYRRALEELNRLPDGADRLVHPHEVVAIEDSPAGVRAAAAAGLRTVALTEDGERGVEADAILAELRELTPEWLRERLGEP